MSTYRLQLGPDLTFAGAAAALPYLDALGVTDLYLSPVLQAAPGSTHGYDVVDHSRISDVLGGRAGLEALAAAAHARGMGVVVDVVPNHMAVPTPAWHNRALWSVLKHGPDSPYATWFDIDVGGGEGVLMPVLGARVGTVLAAGELTVGTAVVPTEPDAGEQPVLRYYYHVFPVRAGTEQLPLAELLERQHYRLAYWRVADEELNYRRFFDVGTLAAVRVEDPEVFAATHALLLALLADGVIDALRIDHPDGLADPRGYFRRLHEATGGAWVAAEKILEGGEQLPADWPVAGTTGYDAAWRLGALQVEPAGALPLGGLLAELTGDVPGALPAEVERSKRQVVSTSLYAEVHRLATQLHELCHADIRLRDHTFRSLFECVAELVVAMDRYRAYVVPGESAPAGAEAVLRDAADRARARLEPDRHETLDVVLDLLLGKEVGSAGRSHEARRGEAIVRFQQVCGAVTAKGVEDTAFYRWTHLVSLCEVGADAERFGLGADELHAWVQETAAAWPVTMTAGSTHDTKRGEDVRARIGVLSQHAEEWVALVHDLRTATEPLRPADLDGRTENLLWQTLAGTWTPAGPIEADRLRAYLTKAAREQKTWTSWTAPAADREAELVGFADALLQDDGVRAAFDGWVASTGPAVRAAVLGTKLLQLTILGVADVYQGTEVTRTSLVDPDNRRPVDFAALAGALARLDDGAAPVGLDEEKLQLTAAALRLRRARPGAFVGAGAGYEPLPTTSGHAVALARTDGDGPQVVAVATRLAHVLDRLGGFGEHTVVLPPGRWRGALTGATYDGGAHRLADLLAARPVALLERVG
ncbi:malto-oligosyltrehalose synthase [Georgenia sp. TF02-10]|uniref:malto-oligosyltrehalose synthase n=1 Tax=Georgenia sp. TF02-10 TaxID=2917725 RepID=UPI001FA7C2AB|nr:malto-oligosyltrehalose synthase [Georgenia sp. TF02-10]UNX56389.1 malto-oligosyltrehalose synthase [Georgenia sp. TF02-10]